MEKEDLTLEVHGKFGGITIDLKLEGISLNLILNALAIYQRSDKVQVLPAEQLK